MTSSHNDGWMPSPMLLAAYFDGEFEGRDDLAALRERLQAWLAAHPSAGAELTEYRRLRQLWQETVPAEPCGEAWAPVLAELKKVKEADTAASTATPDSSFILQPSFFRRSRPLAYLAGAAVVLLAALLMERGGVNPADTEPFPVASAHEVEIMHVEGKDTGTLVVGLLPLEGDMELAGPGDVTLTSVAPAKYDNMVPNIHLNGPGPPIIWARSGAEED